MIVHFLFFRSKVDELDDRIKRLESPDKVTARTCEEIHYFEPQKKSGDYWVDPDGHLAGDSPIKVYCNMTTGNNSFKIMRFNG